MSAAVDTGHMPFWPRFLSQGQAASYLGVSAGTFRTIVTVKPVRIGRRVLYDRLLLDRFADTLSGIEAVDAGAGWADTCELE